MKVIDDETGRQREENRANARTDAAESGDRCDGVLGKEIAWHCLNVIDPALKAEQNDRNKTQRCDGAGGERRGKIDGSIMCATVAG